jgi:hypothetical protein
LTILPSRGIVLASNNDEKLERLREELSIQFLNAWKVRGHLAYGSVGLVIALVSFVLSIISPFPVNLILGLLVFLIALIYGLIMFLRGLVGRRKLVRKEIMVKSLVDRGIAEQEAKEIVDKIESATIATIKKALAEKSIKRIIYGSIALVFGIILNFALFSAYARGATIGGYIIIPYGIIIYEIISLIGGIAGYVRSRA